MTGGARSAQSCEAHSRGFAKACKYRSAVLTVIIKFTAKIEINDDANVPG